MSGDGGGGSVDRDGGSVLVAVELTCLATAAAVDRWTDGGSVLVAGDWTCLATAAAVHRCTKMGGSRSRADVSSGGGGSGALVDRDSGSVLVAVELTCLATAAAVDRWTETGAVCSLQSS